MCNTRYGMSESFNGTVLRKHVWRDPQYDITAIDPWVYAGPLTHVVDPSLGIVFHFKNLNVTGLRHQKISDFQMDTTAKSVILKTRANLNIVSDVNIELDGKPFKGVYTATTSVFGTARYSYSLRSDNQGVQFFVVGPETLTCEVVEEPDVSLSQPLRNALSNDDVAKSKLAPYTASREKYRREAVCKIAEKAYEAVVHNIRAAAQILPVSAFFKDL